MKFNIPSSFSVGFIKALLLDPNPYWPLCWFNNFLSDYEITKMSKTCLKSVIYLWQMQYLSIHMP
ncbi:hypothetical protein SAMN03080602_03704 [Arenibacter troitsensis]|uniref:Uncharacterized protein n=1 Tax=Arenibacter troitsensis TaxID=188872 RepID=A0A1X7L4I4_9FLAO|nr:hypothetical protein SAMN03080602_03704 [Arenibacter troitsensis]